jgi:hypothetical protein
MPSEDLAKLWAEIKLDLQQARSTLSHQADKDPAINEYQEYLDHNEFELASDALRAYAEDHQVSRDFWRSMWNAATKMKLKDQAEFYKSKMVQ